MQGAAVDRPPHNTENDQQFDVAATWKNRLILVECKATRPTVDHGRWIAGGAHRAGGLFGLKLLVATGEADAAVVARTAALDWRLVSGPDILRLHERVGEWMRGVDRG